VIKKGKELFFL